MIVEIYQVLPGKKKLLIVEKDLHTPSINLPIGDDEKVELIEIADTESGSFKYNAKLVKELVGSSGYYFISII